MKKILVAICLFSTLNAFSTETFTVNKSFKSYNDTTVLTQIATIPLNTYIGKPVDSLFLVLPSNFTTRKFMPTRGSSSNGVYQAYGTSVDNSVVVQIFIDSFQYVSFPFRSNASSWDMNLAKQETISFIRIVKNDVCVYGCGHPNYKD